MAKFRIRALLLGCVGGVTVTVGLLLTYYVLLGKPLFVAMFIGSRWFYLYLGILLCIPITGAWSGVVLRRAYLRNVGIGNNSSEKESEMKVALEKPSSDQH